MITLTRVTVFAAVLAMGSALWASGPAGKSGDSTSAARRTEQTPEAMRSEGEQRFRANCSRCHAAPHKFPPRMMATIVRHMRVRATITDDDMRLVLYYMTQ
jgi:mono/diheme cytochrome c family protein